MLQRKKRSSQKRSAFTLMEMLIVVAIIVMLAGIGGVFLYPQLVGARKDTAAAQVKGLTKACMAYAQRHQDQFPDSLRQLTQKDEHGFGPYIESVDDITDPWGKEYLYNKSGPNNQGLKPDISTQPPDGGPVIGNWPKQR
jgi:general secretion pathway protein G